MQEITLDFPYLSNTNWMFGYGAGLDRLLQENGDRILLENGDFLRCDDVAGVFDTLVRDTPAWWIDSVELMPNRDKFNMMAFMSLDAGDFIELSETMTGIENTSTFCISGYDLEIADEKYVKWRPVLVSSLQYPAS